MHSRLRRSERPPRSLGILLALAPLLVTLAPHPAAAKSCFLSLPYQHDGEPTPIDFCPDTPTCHLTPPPATLWGELEPRQVIHNATHYRATTYLAGDSVAWTDLDIEGNLLAVSHWAGLLLYDASNPTGISTPIASLDGWQGDFPVWLPPLSEIDQVFGAVAIPDGDASFAVVAGILPGGVAVVDLTDPASPLVRFQDDTAAAGNTIYAARVGDRSYAFVPTAGGMRIYDLTQTRDQDCVGASASSPTNNCPGALHLTVPGASAYINGARLSDGRVLVARSAGFYSHPGAFDIWDAGPLVDGTSSAALATRSDTRVNGVAIWEHRDAAGTVYVATRETHRVQVYRLAPECLEEGACAAQPEPVPDAFEPVAYPLPSANYLPLSFSWSGDVPFVFAGTAGSCRTTAIEPAADAELIRLANPADPAQLALADVSPRQQDTFTSWTLPDPDGVPPAPQASRTIDYWGWYERNHAWGWGSILPRAAKFKGPHLIRAAHTVGDVHYWNDPNGGPEPLFADGFESADTGAWSASVP